MQIKNTKNNFGVVAITLHWLIALIIIVMLALGLYMTDLPISLQKLKLYGWHKEFGVLVLMLVIARVTWRLTNINPTLATLPWWEYYAARAMHYVLYGFMLAMPITGWAMSSAAGFPVSFFGLFVLPDLVLPNESARIVLAEIHKYLAFALIAAIVGHAAAALKHQFIDKDDILRRMLKP